MVPPTTLRRPLRTLCTAFWSIAAPKPVPLVGSCKIHFQCFCTGHVPNKIDSFVAPPSTRLYRNHDKPAPASGEKLGILHLLVSSGLCQNSAILLGRPRLRSTNPRTNSGTNSRAPIGPILGQKSDSEVTGHSTCFGKARMCYLTMFERHHFFMCWLSNKCHCMHAHACRLVLPLLVRCQLLSLLHSVLPALLLLGCGLLLTLRLLHAVVHLCCNVVPVAW